MLFATGGFGRIFKITSNALAGTGDGVAIPYRRGVPLMDMEFYQFHPTGIYKLGILLSEAARGEGGILRNGDGERSGALCADAQGPGAARHGLALHLSGNQGRAGHRRQGLRLPRSDPPAATKCIDAKLPDITDFARTYLGVEPKTEPVPIQPTAHYAMGGIPTDIDGRGDSRRTGHADARLLRGRRGAPASRSTAPTGSAPTRWSIWSSSAAAPASTCCEFCPRRRDFAPLPADPERWRGPRSTDLLARPKGEARGGDPRRRCKT